MGGLAKSLQTAMRARLIVIEGPDNVGKTSLVKKLSSSEPGALEPLGIAFPGHDRNTLGAYVYALHHQSNLSISPLSLQTAHVAAHVDAIQTRIRPALDAGRDVILDRYWWSTWVYGHACGAEPDLLDALIKFEEMVWGHSTPELIISLLPAEPFEIPDYGIDEWYRLQLLYRTLAVKQSKTSNVSIVGNVDAAAECLSNVLTGSRA